MDMGYLNEFTVPVVLLVCLCTGYIIKNSLDFIPNKYIPLILAVLGIVVNLVNCSVEINQNISDPSLGPLILRTIVSGAMSGLMSTGTYEAFRNLIEGKDK